MARKSREGACGCSAIKAAGALIVGFYISWLLGSIVATELSVLRGGHPGVSPLLVAEPSQAALPSLAPAKRQGETPHIPATAPSPVGAVKVPVVVAPSKQAAPSKAPLPSPAQTPAGTVSPELKTWPVGDTVPTSFDTDWSHEEAAAWLVAHGVSPSALEVLDDSDTGVPPAPSTPPVGDISHIPMRLPEEGRREPPLLGPAADSAYLNTTMPQGRVDPGDPAYPSACGALHGRHAIVTMATGDNAARQALGLLQSLRDVGTCPGIDLVVMLFGGGVGSADCVTHRVGGKCATTHPSSPDTVVSQMFLRAFHRLGVKLQVNPPLGHHANGLKTVNIPGGSQLWWGMALNKLQVFNMTQYDKVLWLDSDVFAVRNLDHLLFYPELTAAFTQECCNPNSAPKISGGFWVIQPSQARMAQMTTALSRESPLVPLKYEGKSWQYGDMSVVLSAFGNPSQAPPWPSMPGAICPRQSRDALATMYKEGPIRTWMPYDQGVVLAGPQDTTVMPLDPTAMGQDYWHARPGDANLLDGVAGEVGAPVGRVWHMLNASYDYLPVECHCVHEAGDKRGQTRPSDAGWFFSVHFTCMPPGAEKPGSFKHISQLVNLPKIPPCVRPWYRRWMDAFARAMGGDFPSAVYHSRS